MKKKQFKKILLVAVISGIMSGCASTNEMVVRYKSFKSLDVNEDDLISRREAKGLPAIANSFNRFDTDDNQNISKAEYKAASTRLAYLDFKTLDYNKDGVLSRNEAAAIRPSLKAMYKRVDTDKDNNISVAEYNAATVNLMKDLKFTDIDRDGDGVISILEARVNPTLKSEFKAIDIDSDKIISKSEFRWGQQL